MNVKEFKGRIVPSYGAGFDKDRDSHKLLLLLVEERQQEDALGLTLSVGEARELITALQTFVSVIGHQ